jgi:hypothetical protein
MKTQLRTVKGLIVASPHIDRILAGRKTWEMRSRHVLYRGPVGLIRKGSGLVVGMANIVGCKGPLSWTEFRRTRKHALHRTELRAAFNNRWRIAWILADIRSLATPLRYRHRTGAMSWVTLGAAVSKAIIRKARRVVKVRSLPRSGSVA